MSIVENGAMAGGTREERGEYRGGVVHYRWLRYGETLGQRLAHPRKLIVEKSQHRLATRTPQNQANGLPVTVEGKTATKSRRSSVLDKCYATQDGIIRQWRPSPRDGKEKG